MLFAKKKPRLTFSNILGLKKGVSPRKKARIVRLQRAGLSRKRATKIVLGAKKVMFPNLRRLLGL